MASLSNATIIDSSIPSSRRIIFNVFIILLIPSLACSLLIFSYFIRMPQLRQQQSNHVILLLLLVLFIEGVTDLPIRLHYLYRNTVLIHTGSFCLFWNWIASVLNIIGLHLMALGSIERHLFVFHNQFLSRHRFLLSKLPMIFSIIYPLAFYTGVIFGSWWCVNAYDYSTLACGPPCYLITSTFFPLFGIFTHHVLPVFMILFTNLLLVIRVCRQKSRMNQRNMWRKNVRMAIQLLSIALIYLLVWVPQCIFFLMLAIGTPEMQALGGSLIYEYTGNFTSFTILFCPFITIINLPQMCSKIKGDLMKIVGRRNEIVPSGTAPPNTTRRVGTNLQRTH